jgi:hypothetical protein
MAGDAGDGNHHGDGDGMRKDGTNANANDGEVDQVVAPAPDANTDDAMILNNNDVATVVDQDQVAAAVLEIEIDQTNKCNYPPGWTTEMVHTLTKLIQQQMEEFILASVNANVLPPVSTFKHKTHSSSSSISIAIAEFQSALESALGHGELVNWKVVTKAFAKENVNINNVTALVQKTKKVKMKEICYTAAVLNLEDVALKQVWTEDGKQQQRHQGQQLQLQQEASNSKSAPAPTSKQEEWLKSLGNGAATAASATAAAGDDKGNGNNANAGQAIHSDAENGQLVVNNYKSKNSHPQAPPQHQTTTDHNHNNNTNNNHLELVDLTGDADAAVAAAGAAANANRHRPHPQQDYRSRGHGYGHDQGYGYNYGYGYSRRGTHYSHSPSHSPGTHPHIPRYDHHHHQQQQHHPASPTRGGGYQPQHHYPPPGYHGQHQDHYSAHAHDHDRRRSPPPSGYHDHSFDRRDRAGNYTHPQAMSMSNPSHYPSHLTATNMHLQQQQHTSITHSPPATGDATAITIAGETTEIVRQSKETGTVVNNTVSAPPPPLQTRPRQVHQYQYILLRSCLDAKTAKTFLTHRRRARPNSSLRSTQKKRTKKRTASLFAGDDDEEAADAEEEAAKDLHVATALCLWSVRDLQFVYEQVQDQQNQQVMQQQEQLNKKKTNHPTCKPTTPGQEQQQQQEQQLDLRDLDWADIATKFNARHATIIAGSTATASHTPNHDNVNVAPYFMCPPKKKKTKKTSNASPNTDTNTAPNTNLLQLHTTIPQVQAVFEAMGRFLFQRQEEGHGKPYVRHVHVRVVGEVATTGAGAGTVEAVDDESRKRAWLSIITTEGDGRGAHEGRGDADMGRDAKRAKIATTGTGSAEGESENAAAATRTANAEMEIDIAKTLKKKRLQRQHVILVKRIMTAFAKQCLEHWSFGNENINDNCNNEHEHPHPLTDFIGTFHHCQEQEEIEIENNNDKPQAEAVGDAEAEADTEAGGDANKGKERDKYSTCNNSATNEDAASSPPSNANATCIADHFWTRLLQDLHVQETSSNPASAVDGPPFAEEKDENNKRDADTNATDTDVAATTTTEEEKESPAPAAKDKNVHAEADGTVAATITTNENETESAPSQTPRDADAGITTTGMDTDTLKSLFYDSVITEDFFMFDDHVDVDVDADVAQEDHRAQVIDTTTTTVALIVADQETEDAATAAALATCHDGAQEEDPVGTDEGTATAMLEIAAADTGTATQAAAAALATLSNTGDKVEVEDICCFPQWRIGFLLRELLVQWQHRFDHDNNNDDELVLPVYDESNTFWNHCSSALLDGWDWVALAKVVSAVLDSDATSPHLDSGARLLTATTSSTITPFDLKAKIVATDAPLLKFIQHIREHCFAATSASQDALVTRTVQEAEYKKRQQMKVRHHPWTVLELGVLFREVLQYGHHKDDWIACLKAFPAEFHTKEEVIRSSKVRSVTKDKAKDNTSQHMPGVMRLRYEMKLKAEQVYWLRGPFEPWSNADTYLVFEQLLKYGKDWILISEHLMGRSAFDVQRYYETYELPEEESSMAIFPLLIKPTHTITSILRTSEKEEADIMETETEAPLLEDAEADVDVDTEVPRDEQDGTGTSIHNKDADTETEAPVRDAEAPHDDQDQAAEAGAGTGESIHNTDLGCNWTVVEHVVLLRELDPNHKSRWAKAAKFLPRRSAKDVEDHVMGDYFVLMHKVKEANSNAKANANANKSLLRPSKNVDKAAFRSKIKTSWTREETETLMQHALVLGRNAWDQVTQALPRRTPHEARIRFYTFRLGESFCSDDGSCTGKAVAVAGDNGDDSDRTNSSDDDDANPERDEVHISTAIADEQKKQEAHLNGFDAFLEAAGANANPDFAIKKEWTDEEINVLWYKFEQHGKAWKTIKRALPHKTTDQCKFKLDELLKWNLKDDNALIAAHAAYIRSGGGNHKTDDACWNAIVDNADILPNRGVRELENRYEDLRNEYLKRSQKRSMGRWTREEKELLAKLVIQYGYNWKKIQTQLPGRTLQLVKGTFYRLKIGGGNVARGELFAPPDHPDDPFSIIEDGIIVREVLKWNYKLTDDQWHKIATLLPGRTLDKIQDRYTSHLKAKIPYKKYTLVPWTDAEMDLLFGTYLKYGPDYTIMHNALKGRTWLSVSTQFRHFKFSSASAKGNERHENDKDDETKDNNDNGKDKEPETHPWSIVEQGVLMRQFSRHGRDWDKIAASLPLLPCGRPRLSGIEVRQQFQLLEPEFARENPNRAALLRQHLHKGR